MQYVHYWHFYKRWYAQVIDNPKPVGIFWHNDGSCQEFWDREYLVTGSEWLTHREIKERLAEMYPDATLVRDKPFHEGARWFGNKNRSYRHN